MKKYNLEDYKNFAELKSELLKELKQDLIGLEIKVADEIGKITDVVEYSTAFGTLDVVISAFDRNLLLIRGTDSGYISGIPADLIKVIKENVADNYDKELVRVKTKHDEIHEVNEVERNKRREAYEAAVIAKQKKLAEEKQLRKLQNLAKTSANIKISDNFYSQVAWLAKNVSNVYAQIPEYMNDAFSSIFGEDAERHLVDTSKKTSGGYDMQYTFSFSLRFNKDLDVENTPISIAKINKDKTIKDTELIYYLVDKCNFKFGKKQDINEIRQIIPKEHLAEFDLIIADEI